MFRILQFQFYVIMYIITLTGEVIATNVEFLFDYSFLVTNCLSHLRNRNGELQSTSSTVRFSVQNLNDSRETRMNVSKGLTVISCYIVPHDNDITGTRSRPLSRF